MEDEQQIEPPNLVDDAHSADRSKRRAWTVLLLSILLLWYAIRDDAASMPEWILSVRSPFLGIRFQLVLWGAILGALFRIFYEPISEKARQVFDATIGNTETTAWALQGALALLVIIAVIFVVKPDLLSYIRSVEYGGFKATFAAQSTASRQANLNYKEFLFDFSLKQYEDLFKNYIDPISPRGIASTWVHDTRVDLDRQTLTAALYPKYVGPVVKALICLERNHAIDAASHDPSLIAYASRWENFILNLKLGPPRLSDDSARAFLQDIAQLSAGVEGYAGTVIPSCGTAGNTSTPSVPVSSAFDINQDAMILSEKYNDARTRFGPDASDYQVLLILEPYLVGALGDLIAILNDQKRKADFLIRTLDGFYRSDNMLTPGIINIFYQVADAQLRSSENWPFENILTKIDYAIHGVDLMIARSSEKIDTAIEKDTNGFNKVPVERQIYNAFSRNLLILLSEKLNLFNQRIFTSEKLSEGARQDWLSTYARIIAILRARSAAPISVIEKLPDSNMDNQERSRWRLVKIEPEYLMDADIAIALSSMLIEESGSGTVSALGCNTAQYFVRRAKFDMGQLVSDPQSFVHANKNVAVTELKLNRIVTVIGNHIANACDMENDRESAKLE